MTRNVHTRTFNLAIRAPDNGHSLSATFPVSPSPIGYFRKEQSGTDFGKAEPAGVRQRDRGDKIPAGRSPIGKIALRDSDRLEAPLIFPPEYFVERLSKDLGYAKGSFERWRVLTLLDRSDGLTCYSDALA